MFDRDDYGADYMRDTYPWNKMSPEQCNALFDRMGDVLRRRVHLSPIGWASRRASAPKRR